MGQLELRTRRLLLRPAGPADAGAIYAYRSDPVVSRYQGRPKNLAAARRTARRNAALKPCTPGTWYQLAVTRKAGGELIGDICVHFTGERQAEIGYTLAPAWQGRGYAAEGVRAVLRWIFDGLGLHRVSASADPRNKSSLRLMRRVGMRREGYFRKSFWTGREWADDVRCAILREEWPTRRRG